VIEMDPKQAKSLAVVGSGGRLEPISKRWLPANPQSSQPVFEAAMRLLAEARPRGMKRSAAVAYRIATADFCDDDLINGVSAALRCERYVTPAAVVDHCAKARDARICIERRARFEGK
jgi:hypothetical protein